MSDAKVWVGCLGCYNAGVLRGEWVDAIEAGDVTPATLNTANGLTNNVGYHLAEAHEELWVMDFEGFDGLLTGECSPSEAQKIAEKIEELESEDLPVAAFAAWANNYHDPVYELDIDGFRDSYRGEWGSVREYVEDWAESTGLFSVFDRFGERVDVPSQLEQYFDWDSYTRDMESDLTVIDAENGNVYILEG